MKHIRWTLLTVTLLACICLCSGCLFGGGEQEGSGDPVSIPTGTPTTTTTTTEVTTTTTTTRVSVFSVGYCTADSLNVRSGPGLDYRGIGGLVHGEKVTVLGQQGDWYQIQFGDTVGYVSAQYISATPPAQAPSSSRTTLPPIGTDLTGRPSAPTTTTVAAQ